MKNTVFIFPLLAMAACSPPINEGAGTPVAEDGVETDTGDPNPGPACDDPFDVFLDADGDGYGDSALKAEACELPARHVRQGGDCDDMDAGISPGAEELCDGRDQDCDGAIDEDLESIDWYPDADGDGYGRTEEGVTACANPDDGLYVTQGGDCDDESAERSPAAVEVCDGLDQDCDDAIDEDLESIDWYPDADGDGYGRTEEGVTACANPDDGLYVTLGGDCDDASAERSPDAVEVCDGLDQDCDGETDEDFEFRDWYADVDGDGYGDPIDAISLCDVPDDRVDNALDCDDSDPDRHPAAMEVCDGIDQNCDDAVDEGLEVTLWFADDDGDGFGDPEDSSEACAEPAGRVHNSEDCDDSDASVSPVAEELCNGIDDDCNGAIDDGSEARDWYADADGDGFGDPSDAVSDCAELADRVLNDLDCDDSDPSVSPEAPEVCNGLDDDCSGEADDGLSFELWYLDADADGYGDPDGPVAACSPDPERVLNNLDCNDADFTIHPGAEEELDKIDNDCSDEVDDLTTDHADVRLDGSGLADGFGYSLGSGSDLDDDGITDLVVGAYESGTVTLFSGASLGSDSDADDAMVTLTGTDASFGRTVTFLEDLNSDGLVDLAVGSPAESTPSGGIGTVQIYFGPLDTLDATSAPDAEILSSAGGSFGSTVADAGMLTDGHRSLAVYGSIKAGDAPGLYIYSAGESSVALAMSVAGSGTGDEFGHAVVGGHDLNGDGLDDLMVGAPSASVGDAIHGAAYVFYSPYRTGLDVFDADDVIPGDSAGDDFGFAMSAMDDWDGDGHTDVVISAPGSSSDEGQAFLFQPTSLGDGVDASGMALATYQASGGELGTAVSSAGDLDGDGMDEVVLGAPSADPIADSEGSVYVYWSSGASGVLTPDARIDGLGSGAHLGTALGGIVDESTGALIWQAVGGFGADSDDGGSLEIETGSVWFFEWD